MRISVRPACLLLMLGVFAGCQSPEATRVRGGGPGADIGNRGPVVEMHAGSRPYHETPCVTEVECTGPLPVFGPKPATD